MSDTKVISRDDRAFDNILKTAIAPRPICFASTVNSQGQVNLSPFSYFNIVSHNPPICIFSPLLRGRDGSAKHTLDNIRKVPELVINVVNYAMVQQQSLASAEYEKGINEFEKAGFTAVASELIRPPRVKESPVQLECKVREVVALADTPGAGQLVIAEILRLHVRASLLGENDTIDQAELDLVARLGGDWYTRVTAESLFEVAKPNRNIGIGVDQLPSHIRQSIVLTGNHLGQLGNVSALPDEDEVDAIRGETDIQGVLQAFIGDKGTLQIHLHRKAAELLDAGNVEKAWKVLLLA